MRIVLTNEAGQGVSMNNEKIKVRITESGKILELVVLRKAAERIEVVVGEGVTASRANSP